jgi:hypothetical protein
MNHRISGLARIAAWMFVLLVTGRGWAAGEDALLQEMTTLNASAIDAYSAGDFDKAKGRLLQAVALGKKDAGLRTHPLMARTYMHLGALYVDGFEDRKTGIGYFVKALKIRPDIDMTDSLVTKTVTSALAQAKKEAGVPEESEATAAAEGSKEKEGSPATQAENKSPDKSERGKSAKDQAVQAPASKLASRDEKGADTEALQKLQKALAAAESNEAKERAAREKSSAEKQQRDKELTEAKALVLELQKDKAEKGKQALAEKERLEKQLASSRDSDAKERAAKDKLAAEKLVSDKALADLKAQVQQLQKDKADKEKQLAETADREKKEKEAKEKLLADKQASETRDKQRQAQAEAVRLQREKSVAGPELPARFAEQVYCDIPDEVPVGTELFVHCVARPSLNAKGIAFYYRSNTGMHYNSVELEPAREGVKKGWSMTVIPASRVSGKAIQYYVEAFDGSGAPVAASGKPGSPNILALRPVGGAGSLKSAAFVKKR